MNKEDVKRIAEDFNKSIKERIELLLEADTNMYTNLGLDSTKSEKEEVKKKSRVIYRAIKELDNSIGSQLLYYQDK